MKQYQGPEDFQALFTALKKAVVERALKAEMSAHLGYEKGQDKPDDQPNHRNGSSGKTVLSESGSMQIEIPWDRGQLPAGGAHRPGRIPCGWPSCS